MTDTQTLLAQYVRSGSELAFRELVTRYIDLVHSTAFRLVGGDTQLAEDVAQTVFVALARKARSLPADVMLGGWLHQHTLFVARKTIRGERRRQNRERQAVEMNAVEDHSEANLAQVAPILDHAISQLRAEDRKAILLRFFEQLDLRSVGEALGSSEDAARKRVNRALDQLHSLLKRRGRTFSAAALGTALLTQAVTAAPTGLAVSIAGTAFASAGAGGGVMLSVVKALAMTKAQLAFVSAIIIASVATTLVIQKKPQPNVPVTKGEVGSNELVNIPRSAPNNNFVNRLTLGTPAHVSEANFGATAEGGERNQSGITRWGATLWWRWTAPASGLATIDTLGSSYDTFLAVYTGKTVTDLRVISENDNASEVGVGSSLVTFSAQQGTEYEIQVGGVYTGGRGGIPVTGDLKLNLAMPPSVAITLPLRDSTFLVSSNVAVKASAMSIAGAITNVSLYRGATLLGSTSAAPYNFVLSNAPVGVNALYAAAADSIGQVGTSAVVKVLAANVGVTIAAPSDDEIFQSTSPITVSAFPMLRTGSITNVTFFVDGRLIGQETTPSTSGFSKVWNSVTSGSHRFTASGLDDLGQTYSATPVNISVARVFFPQGSVWKFLDDGSDQGVNWYAPKFKDSSWHSGPAELGYGDGDEATRVEDNATPGFNADDIDHYITTYFRRTFVVTNIASYTNLLMNVKRDDGAVVYLNGREAARFNMNTGAVDYLTLARNASEDGKNFFPATVPASLLMEGINVIAVEIHQATADSTDISFDMDLSGIPRVIH